jgi:hypothetical protein
VRCEARATDSEDFGSVARFPFRADERRRARAMSISIRPCQPRQPRQPDRETRLFDFQLIMRAVVMLRIRGAPTASPTPCAGNPDPELNPEAQAFYLHPGSKVCRPDCY